VYRLAGRSTNRPDGFEGKSLLSCGLPVFARVSLAQNPHRIGAFSVSCEPACIEDGSI
jgi:hypothetical protein